MKSTLQKAADRVKILSQYLESAAIPDDDAQIAKAAKYLWTTRSDSNRCENASKTEVLALSRFVTKYCK